MKNLAKLSPEERRNAIYKNPTIETSVIFGYHEMLEFSKNIEKNFKKVECPDFLKNGQKLSLPNKGTNFSTRDLTTVNFTRFDPFICNTRSLAATGCENKEGEAAMQTEIQSFVIGRPVYLLPRYNSVAEL